MDSINVTGRDDRFSIYRSTSADGYKVNRLVWNS